MSCGMGKYLTQKRLTFVSAYLANGRNGLAAYRTAYPGRGGTVRTHTNAAWRLLQEPRVAALVAAADEREQAALRETAERHAITKQRLIERLAVIVFAEPVDYLCSDDGGVPRVDYVKLAEAQAKGLVEVTVWTVEAGSGDPSGEARRIRIKPVDRAGTIMKLARLMGYLPEQRLIQGVADLTEEEIDALADDTADAGEAASGRS